MRALLLLAALAAAQTRPAPPPARTTASPDPCAGLKFRYLESIASQGFLGFLTPDADGAVVREALDLGLDLAALADRSDPDAPARFDLRPACARAVKAKLRTVWVGCRGDTDEVESRFYGSLSEGAGAYMDRLTAECVVSAYRGRETPDWDALTEGVLLPVGKAQEVIYPNSEARGGDRYDRIDRPKARLQLYAKALQDMFERLQRFGVDGRPDR